MELPSGERERPGASTQASQEQVNKKTCKTVSLMFHFNLLLLKDELSQRLAKLRQM